MAPELSVNNILPVTSPSRIAFATGWLGTFRCLCRCQKHNISPAGIVAMWLTPVAIHPNAQSPPPIPRNPQPLHPLTDLGVPLQYTVVFKMFPLTLASCLYTFTHIIRKHILNSLVYFFRSHSILILRTLHI